VPARSDVATPVFAAEHPEPTRPSRTAGWPARNASTTRPFLFGVNFSVNDVAVRRGRRALRHV
jgi:hypothetical protein